MSGQITAVYNEGEEGMEDTVFLSHHVDDVLFSLARALDASPDFKDVEVRVQEEVVTDAWKNQD